MKNLILQTLRNVSPGTWQFLKYRQYLLPSIGEPEIHFVSQYIDPKRAAVDVGVHMGFYTRHFAKYATEVFGFEANPDSAKLAVASLGRLAKIEWAAMSDAPGAARLKVPLAGAKGAEAALGTLAPTNSLSGEEFREIEVQMKRLDDCALPPVGFVKIDVEGHEEAVLRGGETLLQRDRPVYMIEVEERHNPGSTTRIPDYFAAFDYETFYYIGDQRHKIGSEPFDHQKLQSGSGNYVNNFFFCPRKDG